MLSKEQILIIGRLQVLWELHSEQRLGQLLENYVFVDRERGDKTSVKLFYQEDHVTLDKITAKMLEFYRMVK